MHNIEKLPGKPHYTGYACGVWRIVKDGRLGWRGTRESDGALVRAQTLRGISAELYKLSK